MKKPKISIVIIAYNEEIRIEETLVTICNQTYFNLEIIIKDGNSTDATLEIVNNVKAVFKDKEIKVISKSDVGIYSAMNQAIENSTGDWIAFINAGDKLVNDDILSEIFYDEDYYGYDVIYGDAIVSDISGDMIWKADMKKIKKSSPFCHQACFVSKTIYQTIKFNEMFKIAADYNMMLDIYDSNYKFYNTKKVIACYPLDGISSTKYLEKIREQIKVIKLHNYKLPFYWVIWKYLEAIIKEIITVIIPLRKQILIRKIYMKYIKLYCNT